MGYYWFVWKSAYKIYDNWKMIYTACIITLHITYFRNGIGSGWWDSYHKQKKQQQWTEEAHGCNNKGYLIYYNFSHSIIINIKLLFTKHSITMSFIYQRWFGLLLALRVCTSILVCIGILDEKSVLRTLIIFG